jgi:general transcription factor 3C polypeptide 3 (transcription factor C subunit 4)
LHRLTPTDYFLRALALDPESATINLSVGLAYVHYALRRQADNRQHLILQGMTFMQKYYNSRRTSTKIEERQEGHYNMARVYHMLGLTNLAVPFYDLVFKEIESEGRASGRDDLVTDAAYNLQSIYVRSGNEELATAITMKWLVI